MSIINTVVKGGGTTPTGTITITNNGTHDVTSYATADVQVPTTVPACYVQKALDANGKIIAPSVVAGLDNATDVGDYQLYYEYYQNTNLTGSVALNNLTGVSGYLALGSAFYDCTGITSVSMNSLTTVSGGSAFNATFKGCTGIISVDMSALTTVNALSACQYMFQNCAGITSVNLSGLKRLYGQNTCYGMFASCTGLTSINLSALEVVDSYSCYAMFNGCSSLASANLDSLTHINGHNAMTGMFSKTALTTMKFYSLSSVKTTLALQYLFSTTPTMTEVWFYALTPSSFGTVYTNQFNLMLSGVTGCTVHFPSNIQATIGSWTDVTGGFGGTNTVVLFDLPSTAHLIGTNTVEYERNPKYDTQTALAWRVKDIQTPTYTIDWTPYYTSGTTDPAVGDTIYSDSACTTSVTTIDSIA